MSHARIGHRKILRVNDLKIFSLQEEVPSMNPSQLYRLSDLCWHLSNSYTTRRAPAGCHVERTTRCGVWYRCGPLEQYDNTNMTCDIWTMPPSRCGGVERVLRSTSDSVRGLPSAATICHHLTVPTQLRRGGKQDYVPCPRPNTGHYTDTGPLLLQWLSRGTCWLLGLDLLMRVWWWWVIIYCFR